MIELTRRQKFLRTAYSAALILCDQNAYAREEEIRARNEIEERLKFYLLNDINKSPGKEIENSNLFTDEERVRYFGKKHVGVEDITWEKLEQLLMPKNVKGAVFRVNDALQGSHINERFSKMKIEGGHSQASVVNPVYIPRTVTIYDNEERARAAAKLLRILTEQSGAIVRAEPLERGTKDPLWVVSDSMDLQTHNALRLLFTHLAHKQTPEERHTCQERAQAEVNKRLPEHEKWESLEGVGTFLTLAGRPGVKMYKKLPNGKDDPADQKAVDSIPSQHLPIYVRGVPHKTVFAPDGRRYMETGNTKAIVGHLLLGPNGYAALTGNRRAMGNLLRKETDVFTHAADESHVFGKGEGLAEAYHSIPSKPLTILAGVISVAGVGTAMLVCTGSYKACQKAAKLIKSGVEFDPIQHKFRPYVVKHAGDPSQPQFSKNWNFRQTGAATDIASDELMAVIQPINGKDITTPLGTVELLTPDSRETPDIQWVKSVENSFCRFMEKNKLWPDIGDLTKQEELKLPEGKMDSAYYGARDRLAKAYVKWVDQLRSHNERTHPHYSPAARITPTVDEAMSPPSTELAERLNDFVKAVQTQQGLPGNTANHILETTREAMRQGMELFQQERAFTIAMPQVG